jgi:hypothetical protein
MSIFRILACSILSAVISACGGGGSGGDSGNFISIETHPLHVIGFSDDGISDPLYPVVDLGIIADGKTVLLRVLDPYSRGDFYSIKVRNGFGEISNGSPVAADGEPDNTPMDATVLTYGNYSHHGLDPVMDEDWFSFTGSAGECCHFASTKPNNSGSGADPVLEVYDPTPDLGPVMYSQDTSNLTDAIAVSGTFDPANNLTLIGMIRTNRFDGLDKNFFAFVFSGPDTPGNYSIRFAGPPVSGDAPNSISGTVHIDRYDGPGGKIAGTFSLAIVDISRTSTIEGSFRVERNQNEPGLLSRLGRAAAGEASSKIKFGVKPIISYLKKVKAD